MTEQTELPADWAIEAALKRVRYTSTIADAKNRPATYVAAIEMARMIERHEKPPVDPPVDPLVLEAREICAAYCRKSGWSLDATLHGSGEHDTSNFMSIALAALKRGIEIGKEQAA